MTDERESRPMPPVTAGVSFRADAELVAKVQEIARERRTSASAVMREALEEFVLRWEAGDREGDQLPLFAEKG